MIKAAPSSPDVTFQLGVVNLAENRFKDAEEAFRRAYQLNPANSRGLMGIVETNMAQNKTEAALALLQAEADKNNTGKVAEAKQFLETFLASGTWVATTDIVKAAEAYGVKKSAVERARDILGSRITPERRKEGWGWTLAAVGL
jgi:thioredoxin-like negative regulator of GroEL